MSLTDSPAFAVDAAADGAATRFAVSSGLWFWLVRPVLMVPVLPAFLVLGLFFLWIGNRGGSRPETSFLGARPPRRRRYRGLS